MTAVDDRDYVSKISLLRPGRMVADTAAHVAPKPNVGVTAVRTRPRKVAMPTGKGSTVPLGAGARTRNVGAGGNLRRNAARSSGGQGGRLSTPNPKKPPAPPAPPAPKPDYDALHEGFGDSGARGLVRRRAMVAGGAALGAAGAAGGGAYAYNRLKKDDVEKGVGGSIVSGLRAGKGRLMATKPMKSFMGTGAGQAARTTYQAGRSGFQNAPAGFGQQMKAGTKAAWGAATPAQKFGAAAVGGTGLVAGGVGVGRLSKEDSRAERRAMHNAMGGIGVAAGAGSAALAPKDIRAGRRQDRLAAARNKEAADALTRHDATSRWRWAKRASLRRSAAASQSAAVGHATQAAKNRRSAAIALGGAGVSGVLGARELYRANPDAVGRAKSRLRGLRDQ